LAVARGELRKNELSGDERAEFDFRLLVRSSVGLRLPAGEQFATAEVVIDATGTFGQHNWLGQGGIPAIGELAAAAHIDYGLPDVLGRARDQYAHHHTLVVGSDPAAASILIALARLGHEAPFTRITWIAGGAGEPDGGPIPRVENDQWPERDRLIQSANH